MQALNLTLRCEPSAARDRGPTNQQGPASARRHAHSSAHSASGRCRQPHALGWTSGQLDLDALARPAYTRSSLETVVPTRGVNRNTTYRENAGGTSSSKPDAQRAGDTVQTDGASPVFGAAANPSPMLAAVSRPGSLPLPWGATSRRVQLLVGVWAEIVACAFWCAGGKGRWYRGSAPRPFEGAGVFCCLFWHIMLVCNAPSAHVADLNRHTALTFKCRGCRHGSKLPEYDDGD